MLHGIIFTCSSYQNLSVPGDASEESKLTKVWKRVGTGRVELSAAAAGDIVSVTGLNQARVADTIGALSRANPLPPGTIEPPTLRYALLSNSCPTSCNKHLQAELVFAREDDPFLPRMLLVRTT